MTQEPLYSALVLCNDLYGVELDEDTFETYAMTAYHKIGNHNYKMKVVRLTPQADPSGGWFVCAPKDLNYIEAITLPFEDAQETSSVINFPGPYTHAIEQDIEAQKIMPSEFYIPGKYVKYQEIGDRIYFTEPLRIVNILYKSFQYDDEDLPYINEKEKNAIAAYCAYSFYFKRGLMTKDTATLQMAQLLKKDWLRLCDAARVAITVSQNDAQDMIDVATSFDRHAYGLTRKPIR